MKHISIKKLLTTLALTTAVVAAATIGASACTTIYVGGNLTQEGTPFVARTEDYGSDMNKLWFISEAGAFKEGETYVGCPAYGAFEWTWTHDSYRFTHFTNDIYYNGVCPECGQGSEDSPVTHFSYTEFGTNEHGVSVSATETISGNSAVKVADPNVKVKENGVVGIEETDIPTVILAEAASAREGIELLCKIYDDYGAFYDSGIFICDKEEVWYIENCSGTQYVAVKLNNDMIFLEPNIAVIGRIDLDDTDNVIASEKLIEVAKQAGTFKGNEAENIIDFRASYANLGTAESPRVGTPRMADGLKFLDPAADYTADDLFQDNSKFTISNVDESDATVDLYTNISVDRELTKDDVFNFYKLSSVGKPSNQEIEIYQLFQDPALAKKYSTVSWVGVGNMSNNVFVPYYPMLIDDMYEGYQESTAVVTQSAEKPDSFCTWSARSGRYVVYPENWRDSYYFTFEGLGGYIQDAERIDGVPVSDTAKQYVLDKLAALQQELYDELVTVDELQAVTNERALATRNGMEMAEKAHKLGLELVDYVSPARNYQEFLDRLDYDQALADAEYLVNEIGVRLTGTQGEQAGLDFLEEEYEKLGYEIERHDFVVETRTSGDITLGDMVIPAGTPTKNAGYAGFTADPVSGSSVYFETPAAAAAAEAGNIAGKIVFFPGNCRTESYKDENEKTAYRPIDGVSADTYEALTALAEKGAAGIVVIMDPDTEATERYQIRVSLPNFERVPVSEQPLDIPVLITSGWDKAKVVDYLEENEGAEVTIEIRDHVDSQSLVVTKKAAVDTDMTLYVTCHIDTVLPAPGASDNASGVVGTLAIARALQNVDTNYNIKFISFGAEEVGLQGAYAYCEDMTEQDIENAIGNYNLDMVGTSDPACEYIFMNSSTVRGAAVNAPELDTHVTIQSREAARTLYNADPDFYVSMDKYLICYDTTTDHYALHLAGIPAVEFDWRANAAGTSFEPYYHTMKDDMDNFSIRRLQQQVDVIALAVYNEATADYAAVTGEGVYRRYYESLGEAVAAVDDGGTVKLLQDSDDTIAISKAITFTLDLNGNEFNGTISAGSGYSLSTSGDTYTVTRRSSSGGGGSSSSSYAVTVGSASNGSVTASPKRAEKGATVTLTVKANSGYELDELIVTDKNGDEIKISAKSENTYTFTMPASAVTVKADFTAVQPGWDNPFHDVSRSSWYYEAVRYATEKGLLSGTSANTFAPGDRLTRGMLVQILWSMEGKPAVSAALTYGDVAESAWYAQAIRWATANDIVSGIGDGKFAPDASVTREQLALILYNYAGRPASPSQQLSFADADKAAAWSQDALRWAVGAGIISGKDGGVLDPQGTATRAEVAQMMMKFDLL